MDYPDEVKSVIAYLSKKFGRMSCIYDQKVLEQEAYTILPKVLDQFDFYGGRASFKTYFSRCLENHYTSLLRRHIREHTRRVPIQNEEELVVVSDIDSKIFVDQVLNKVKFQLSPLERKAFNLMLNFQGSKSKQTIYVSKRLGISYRKAVKMVKRVRMVLNKVLKEG